MTRRKKRTARNPAVETATHVATVLGARLPMLWAMSFNPTPARQAEASRMVSEKITAASHGAFEASLAWTSEYQRLWFKSLTTPLTMADMAEAAGHVTRKGMAPARARLAGNARRLRKSKSL